MQTERKEKRTLEQKKNEETGFECSCLLPEVVAAYLPYDTRSSLDLGIGNVVTAMLGKIHNRQPISVPSLSCHRIIIFCKRR